MGTHRLRSRVRRLSLRQPLDVLLRDDTVLQPDVLVVRTEQVAEVSLSPAALARP
jgi:hypothetical protein